MLDAEIRDLIAPYLERALKHHGLERVDVASGENHYGDPVLFVTLRFGANVTMPSGAEANDVLLRTRQMLFEHGEDRFAHMDYVFPSDRETQLRLRSQVRDLLQA